MYFHGISDMSIHASAEAILLHFLYMKADEIEKKTGFQFFHYPTKRNSLQLETDLDTGEYFEIEIYSDKYSVLWMSGDKVIYKTSGIKDVKYVINLILIFMKKNGIKKSKPLEYGSDDKRILTKKEKSLVRWTLSIGFVMGAVFGFCTFLIAK